MNKKLALLQKKRDAIDAKLKRSSRALNIRIALLKYGIEVGCTLINEDGQKLLIAHIDRRYHLDIEHMSIDGWITTPKRIHVSDIQDGFWKKFEPDADEEGEQ